MNVPAEVTPKGIWDYGPWPKQENFTDWKMAQWTIDHIAEPLDENATPRFLSLGFYRPSSSRPSASATPRAASAASARSIYWMFIPR